MPFHFVLRIRIRIYDNNPVLLPRFPSPTSSFSPSSPLFLWVVLAFFSVLVGGRGGKPRTDLGWLKSRILSPVVVRLDKKRRTMHRVRSKKMGVSGFTPSEVPLSFRLYLWLSLFCAIIALVCLSDVCVACLSGSCQNDLCRSIFDDFEWKCVCS